MQSNFRFLKGLDKNLFDLGKKSEEYFQDDPNTSVIKLRQFGELLSKRYAEFIGYRTEEFATQFSLLKKLEYDSKIPSKVEPLLHHIRKIGNDAAHLEIITHESALTCLKMAVKLGFWYATLISDELNFDTEQFSFIPPKSPKDATKKLKDEINRLKKELNYLERSQPIEYLKSEERRHISTKVEEASVSLKLDQFEDRSRANISFKRADRLAKYQIQLDPLMYQDMVFRRIDTKPWDDE